MGSDQVKGKLQRWLHARAHQNFESAEWVQSARAWLEKSLKSSAAPSSGFVPTRLLDLNTGGLRSDLKLIHPKGVGSADQAILSRGYATLSHHWGRSQTFVLTKEKEKEFTHVIRFAALPKLFQDVIILTRLVKVKYLWIDALCIAQNDLDDWAEEAGQMSRIYGNGLVNIAVHQAENDQVGFLPYWKAGLFGRDVMVARSRERSGRRDIHQFQSLVDESLLSSRGWVFQERLLSPRLLHWTQGSMFWEDDSGCFAEDGSFTDSAGVISNWKKMKIAHDWYSMMELYLRCGLTFEKDRLPAIAGLAASFQHVSQSAYCAGVWANSVHQGLIWTHKTRVSEPAPQNENGPSPPSWSWACAVRGVEFFETAGITLLAQFLEFVPRQIKSESATYDDLSGRACLSLRTGVLHMDGMEVRGLLGSAFKGKQSLKIYPPQNTNLSQRPAYLGSVIFDVVDYVQNTTGLRLMQIACTNPKYDLLDGCRECAMDSEHADYHTEPPAFREIYVLILKEGSVAGCYQRLGIGKVFAHHWPEENTETVDILLE